MAATLLALVFLLLLAALFGLTLAGETDRDAVSKLLKKYFFNLIFNLIIFIYFCGIFSSLSQANGPYHRTGGRSPCHAHSTCGPAWRREGAFLSQCHLHRLLGHCLCLQHLPFHSQSAQLDCNGHQRPDYANDCLLLRRLATDSPWKGAATCTFTLTRCPLLRRKRSVFCKFFN